MCALIYIYKNASIVVCLALPFRQEVYIQYMYMNATYASIVVCLALPLCQEVFKAKNQSSSKQCLLCQFVSHIYA